MKIKKSLTATMLLVTVLIGIVVWLISDWYQAKELSRIFNNTLQHRLGTEAREQRIRFDQYIKAFTPTVKMYASLNQLVSYVNNTDWGKNNTIQYHQTVPVWLPPMSMMRRFVLPRYAMLIDESSQIIELYSYNRKPPPNELIHLPPHILKLAYLQSYLTLIDEQAYIFALESIAIKNGKAIRLLIASPLDEEFLQISQGAATDSIIALLKNDETKIMVSNRSDIIPSGVDLIDLEKNYVVTGEGFFGSGSSDIIVRLLSLMSTAEVNKLKNTIIQDNRRIQFFTALAYIIAFALVMYWVTSRIQKMTRRVLDFSKDMEISQPDIDKTDQIKELETRFELLTSAIRNETAELEHQAYHDPLTDLPNRKLLNYRLQSELFKNELTETKFVLLVSDLDRFKEINDTLGHHIGDLVLQQAASRLYNSLRKKDTVARLGGDEFGMLLPETDASAAQKIAQKIVKIFEEPFIYENQNLNVGISIGIVEFPTHGDDVNILMQRADVAMYNAKKNKLGHVLYESSEDTHSVGRLALISDLRKAINESLLSVYFQPKIDVRNNKIIGAEALLRWNHPERGFIPPVEFIPLAEQTGLISSLTDFVVNEALKNCNYWHQLGYPIVVSINISTHSLQNKSFPGFIIKAIRKHHLAPKYCNLEITESAFMKDPYKAKEILNEIRDFGIDISIDDFGTGYSSLAYLKQLPVSEIKIDRSFVMEMTDDQDDEVIVKITIDLAHNLGLKVVAEGVNNKETLQKLYELGCERVQGYLFSPAISEDEFVIYLEKFYRQGVTELQSTSSG
ncbi:MAG: putative bifunctional diguanylate cyclase/phosphodiesterase [Gammaproteobacteria bacterium]